MQDRQPDHRAVHGRRRGGEELRPGHRRRADIIGVDAPMHKYAVQVTVADARDGAAVRQHAEGGVELGQGRSGLRADGVRRGHARGAAAARGFTPTTGANGRPGPVAGGTACSPRLSAVTG
ncbi:MAG: hypothetical protein U0792_16980 [Gemmataceae bacterium]